MHEEGRRPGARQGCGDLVADVPGLAHAGDDDAAGRLETERACGDEGVVEPHAQGFHGPRFDLQDLAGEVQQFG